MKLYPLGAGDMVEALALLKPRDEETRRAIAGMLGFELGALEAEPDIPQADEDLDTSSPDVSDPTPPDAPTEHEFSLVSKMAQSWPVSVQPSATAHAVPLAQGKAEDTLPRPRFEPLLRRSVQRAVVSTLLKIRRRTGPPLIGDLISAAVKMKPLSHLPASWQESVGGVDVLLDVGDNMQLFSRDQEWLLALIRRVVGEGRVTVFTFSGSPVRGVTSDDEMESRPYAPPRPGWPILMLTDLGIGARLSGYDAPAVSEWREFAKRARTAHCHLMALVPYPRRRWPRIAGLDIVQWDRPTGVGNVRSAVGRAVGA